MGELKKSGEKRKMKNFQHFSSALMSTKEREIGKMVKAKKLALDETLLHAKFQRNRSKIRKGRTAGWI